MVQNECASVCLNTQDSRDFCFTSQTQLYYGAAQDQNSVSYSVAIHSNNRQSVNVELKYAQIKLSHTDELVSNDQSYHWDLNNDYSCSQNRHV